MGERTWKKSRPYDGKYDNDDRLEILINYPSNHHSTSVSSIAESIILHLPSIEAEHSMNRIFERDNCATSPGR